MKKSTVRKWGILTALLFCVAIMTVGTGAYAMGNKQETPPVKKAETAPAKAASGELVGLLTSQLGVTAPQAEGGAGAIFQMAKSKLSPPDFGKIASVVPNMDTLLQAAPALKKANDTAASAMKTIDTLSSLKQSFSTLGLNADMIGKFMPIILSYLQSKGGSTVSQLLSSAVNLPTVSMPSVPNAKSATDTLFNTK